MPGKLEQNVLREMNLINVATYNIGHEVTKKMEFIDVAKTNMDTR